MKNKKVLLIGFSLLATIFVIHSTVKVEATEKGFETNGQVRVEPSYITKPLDPENPLTPVDPGESPSTEGILRIDFVSAINFADAEISKTNRNYLGLAQLFHDQTSARGNYVQVTDLREGQPGWSLQLKQVTQFKNTDNVELNGAVLSFDKGWANSGGIGNAPAVFRDAIAIESLGSSYLVASARKGDGNGTWLMSFGASGSNKQNQENTLSSLKDKSGKKIVDKKYDKQAYLNSAISLEVPENTIILPGDYQTKLSWILQATP